MDASGPLLPSRLAPTGQVAARVLYKYVCATTRLTRDCEWHYPLYLMNGPSIMSWARSVTRSLCGRATPLLAAGVQVDASGVLVRVVVRCRWPCCRWWRLVGNEGWLGLRVLAYLVSAAEVAELRTAGGRCAGLVNGLRLRPGTATGTETWTPRVPRCLLEAAFWHGCIHHSGTAGLFSWMDPWKLKLCMQK